MYESWKQIGLNHSNRRNVKKKIDLTRNSDSFSE